MQAIAKDTDNKNTKVDAVKKIYKIKYRNKHIDKNNSIGVQINRVHSRNKG